MLATMQYMKGIFHIPLIFHFDFDGSTGQDPLALTVCAHSARKWIAVAATFVYISSVWARRAHVWKHLSEKAHGLVILACSKMEEETPFGRLHAHRSCAQRQEMPQFRFATLPHIYLLRNLLPRARHR